MTVTTSSPLTVGKNIKGFTVVAIAPLPHLRMTAYQLVHEKTGAKILHLHNDDQENLFSVSFPTPPPDDSGLPHILEHSVLAGSRKYPVREPFFEMLKMSPATFINAMTGADCTYYPVSSQVPQDLFNLADVYFDAVFHPLLTEKTFKREGHHLAPVDPEQPTGQLKVTGVVYNEMCGAFSDPEARLDTLLNRAMFPDNIYGLESGGDPVSIPELTYENFRKFHATHYHPSNAYFLFYGNIPTEDYLDFLVDKLNEFDRLNIDVSIKRQSRWSAPKFLRDVYPIGANEAKEEKTYIITQWLVGDSTNPQESIDFDILGRILLGNEAAPLKKAIVDAQLGKNLLSGGGASSVGCEGVFSVGLQGSEPERGEQFNTLVLETLEKIAETDIDPELVAAAFQQATYQHQEVARRYPLRMLMRVMQSWIYGGDPLAYLQMEQELKDCQARYQANSHYFNQMIKDHLLNNPHRLTVVMAPDQQWQSEYDQLLSDRTAKICQDLSETELKQIAEEALLLQEDAGTPNPPEAIATLPQLKVSDLPTKPQHLPTTVEELPGGLVLLRNDVFANGVNYLQLNFDLQGLPAELWEYLPLYIEALRKLGATGLSYEQIARRIASNTGGIGFQSQLQTHSVDIDKSVYGLRVTLKTLDEQIEPALSLLHDLLFTVDPTDLNRLRDVVTQIYARYRSDLVYNGIQTALLRAGAGLTLEGYLNNMIGGLPQLELTTKLSQSFEQIADDLINKIITIRDFVISQNLTASFTGSDQSYQLVKNTLNTWQAKRQNQPASLTNLPFQSEKNLRVGLAGPVQVAYCVQVMPAPHYSDRLSPLLDLGSHILQLGYLFSEIRLRGNAYGAGFSYNSLGQKISLYSYRDPHITRTLNVFAKLADYVQNMELSQAEVDRAIIVTTQEDSPVLRPDVASGLALSRYLTGLTDEAREQRYTQTLEAKANDVRQAVLEVLSTGLNNSAICVMSAREKLAEANNQIPEPLVIQDILG
jgi:Zn-dependent M16 (insulinase) family peptidase